MEVIAFDVEAGHLGVGDRAALLVGPGIEDAVDREPGLGWSGADELDHGETIGERAAAPVLRDVAEQPVLDPIPLRGARRVVMDVDREAGLVGEVLQFELPEPQASL